MNVLACLGRYNNQGLRLKDSYKYTAIISNNISTYHSFFSSGPLQCCIYFGIKRQETLSRRNYSLDQKQYTQTEGKKVNNQGQHPKEMSEVTHGINSNNHDKNIVNANHETIPLEKELSKGEKISRIIKLDTDPDRSASKYAINRLNSSEFQRKVLTDALIKTNENLPSDAKKLGTNKLAQALAYDIMARDVESNMIKYTSFEDNPGKLHLAHNYIGLISAALFFIIVIGYACFEMYRSAVYGRIYPEVWGHAPIPWNDEEKLKEFPQSMWPWQKDHPWQRKKRNLAEFEELKKRMKESGEL